MSIVRRDDPDFEATFLRRYAEAKERTLALEGPSLAERFARVPAAERRAFLEELGPLDAQRLLFSWEFWSRPKQRAPTEAHRTFLYLAGRGTGKSRTAAERVRERIYAGAKSIALIGPTWRDIFRYMIGGHLGPKGNGSGLLDVFPPREREQIEVRAQAGEILFHFSGAKAYIVTAEKPEFRGANLDTVWADEVVWWRYLQQIWDNMELALRVAGDLDVEIIVTTTPRPIRFLKELVIDPDTIAILGRTDENAANLDRNFIKRLDQKFGGTRLGRQERDGEILTDNPDALFHQSIIDATRVKNAPLLRRKVVAVDNAIATNPENDETGIVVLGIGDDDHLYVLADVSGRMSPEEWGETARAAYHQHKADAFVVERNRGGDMVAANIRAAIRDKQGKAATAEIIEIHASDGKRVRAEPVAALHEQGRIHFVGVHTELEQEITEWNPLVRGISPNRLDALVHAAWHLAELGDELDLGTDMSGYDKANEGFIAATHWDPFGGGRSRTI